MDHALERAEALQVGLAHIRYQSAIGLHDAAQCGNLAGMVGAGFHNGNVVFWPQAQQGLRHPDVVVEVPQGVEHVETFREHCRGQFLGCCLAVGAADSDNFYLFEISSICSSNPSISLHGIIDT